MAISVARNLVIESDSRGWYWWQIQPAVPLDIIRLPIAYAYITLMSPFGLYFCSYNMDFYETYIRQVTEEIPVQNALRDAVLKEMNQILEPGDAFSIDGTAVSLENRFPVDRSRTLLELRGVKVFLDRWYGKNETTGNAQFGYKLTIESQWVMRVAGDRHEEIAIHEVSSRVIPSNSQDEIPYELFLLIDEHALAIAGRFTKDS